MRSAGDSAVGAGVCAGEGLLDRIRHRVLKLVASLFIWVSAHILFLLSDLHRLLLILEVVIILVTAMPIDCHISHYLTPFCCGGGGTKSLSPC